MNLIVLRNVAAALTPGGEAQVAQFGDLRARGIGRLLRRALLRYQSVEMHTYDVRVVTHPLATGVLLRLLSRGRCEFVDRRGVRERVATGWLLRRLVLYLRDWSARYALIAEIKRTVASLRQKTRRWEPGSGCPLYLRTDLWFGVRSGGSVGHVAGVVNNLGPCAGKPALVSSDELPLIAAEVSTRVVLPPDRFRDFPELWAAHYGGALTRELLRGDVRPSFIYQRYSHNNLAGLRLAHHWEVPLVVEYNGSEVWMRENWGTPLRHVDIAEQVEAANIETADLVVVVSEASRAELESRNLRARRVLVNPNGVDPEMYRPDVDGSAVRSRLQLDGMWTCGFIGTFGRWHGAEVLAEAFGMLLERRADLKSRARLLLIGDGVTLPEVRRVVAARGLHAQVILTGTIAQHEGPAHLAACDVLVSPHVPNPDGTAFFGSPTKLFEYMAMGRPIVASDLDQVGKVLVHETSAILVRPGDPQSLSRGIERLVDDPQLGRALAVRARAEVLARYTWKAHTERIVAALSEISGGPPLRQS